MADNTIFNAERGHFPIFQRGTYFDYATTGLIADYSYRAMKEQMDRRYNQAMNIEEFFGLWDFMDQLREDLGTMFHCGRDEIFFGQSSTQLFNVLANCLNLEPGSEVLMTDTTYPGTSYAWLNKAERGITCRFVPASEGKTDCEEIFAAANAKTKVICLCMVESKSGFRHDLKRIGAWCRERGILLAVDATQAANAMKIDVKEMQIDFLATSGYKWFQSEFGLGIAYIRHELLDKMNCTEAGWVGTVNRRHNDPKKQVLADAARRMEAGGLNFTGFYGLAQAVKHYNTLGADQIQDRILAMTQRVYDRAGELQKIRIYGNYGKENRSSIVTFKLPAEWHITTETMQEQGIRCRVFQEELLRVGFHYYNEMREVEELIDCLKKFEIEKMQKI